MDNFDSLPLERTDRAAQNQLSESAISLLSFNDSHGAGSNTASEANLPKTLIGNDEHAAERINSAAANDEPKPVVERTSHNIGGAIVGGIIGGIASELLRGHGPYYPPPVYNYPYPGYPYPGYPQPYPRPVPIPVPVPVPGWGHGGHHGGHHGRRHW